MLTELQNFAVLAAGDKIGLVVTLLVVLALVVYAAMQYPRGKSTNQSRYRAIGAEFVGTLLLTLAVLSGGVGTVSSSLAAGFAIMILVYLFAGVSSAHFNPAVTIAALLARYVSARRAVVYILVQLIAARTAVWILETSVGFSLQRTLTATLPANVFAEFIGAAVLLFIVATAVIRKESLQFIAALFGVAVAIAPVMTGTGAYINPAISTAVGAGWVTVLMPILGGVAGLLMAYGLTIDRKQLSLKI